MTLHYRFVMFRLKRRGMLAYAGVGLGSGLDVALTYAKGVVVDGSVIGLNDDVDPMTPLARFLGPAAREAVLYFVKKSFLGRTFMIPKVRPSTAQFQLLMCNRPHCPRASQRRARLCAAPSLRPPLPLWSRTTMVKRSTRTSNMHGFNYPSTYAPQPWIWAPRGELRPSAHSVRELRAAGVHASNGGAAMDARLCGSEPQ